MGSTGAIHLSAGRLDEVLQGGARWAVEHSYGLPDDLRFIEAGGCIQGADPTQVSDHAKNRQRDQMGTLGSGNHYLEVQQVVEVYDRPAAEAFGLRVGDIKISIHCGSRGLGHQIGTDFLKKMGSAAKTFGLELPERELACAPIESDLGRSYLGAMRSGINCALANRQILMHLVREALADVLPRASVRLLYDVSHNTCQVEQHRVGGSPRRLFVHRKGATRAWGPGHPELPTEYRKVGQPVLIGGTMGTASYVLVGTEAGVRLSFASSCHGAGRAMSRSAATKKWHGKQVVRDLAQKGVLIRTRSLRGAAEEAPLAYKSVDEVVEASHQAQLATKVARLLPLACIKG